MHYTHPFKAFAATVWNCFSVPTTNGLPPYPQCRFHCVLAPLWDSDRSQKQREDVISMFRKGQITMIVATDVAARGLDVEGVERVGPSYSLATAYSSGFRTVLIPSTTYVFTCRVMWTCRNLYWESRSTLQLTDSECSVMWGLALQVINYDFPTDHIDDYVHRIGRTGRAGATGDCLIQSQLWMESISFGLLLSLYRDDRSSFMKVS